MMQERFKVPWNLETPPFRPAAVTNHHRRDFSVKQPVGQGENGQTQTQRLRDKGDTDRHDQTPQKPVKILLNVKLATLAKRACFKTVFERHGRPGLGAISAL